MKDLFKIYLRYIVTAAAISILIITLNLLLVFIFLVSQLRMDSNSYTTLASLSAALTKQEDGSYLFAEELIPKMEERYEFAMLLDQQGQVVWSRNLPEEIPLSYTPAQIASFSRWYLMDYPVSSWEHPDGLFVVGRPKNSVWKHDLTFPINFIDSILLYLFTFVIFNLLFIFLLALIFGYRFYASLKPLAEGIENLDHDSVLKLPERGLVGDLGKRLNQASVTLQKQRQVLNKRDNARTSWIAGVSHDIRTPLSLIMGHADSLEQDPALNKAQKKEAVSIKENSLQIKQLISDLNLTSKLEYDAYPLRLTSYAPASLLRELSAYYLNNVLDNRYSLELILDPELEGRTLTGDKDLLLRALRNLIQNSIQHNPAGCAIYLKATTLNTLENIFDKTSVNANKYLQIEVMDTGKGIPVGIIQTLYRDAAYARSDFSSTTDTDLSAPHIMGLRIVNQIIKAHGGYLEFPLQKEVCHRVLIQLPIE